MRLSNLLLAAASAAALTAAAAPAAAQAPSGEFGLGENAEGQACRAQPRLDAAGDSDRVDLYCGQWERASGEVVAWPAASAAQALATFARDCPGAGQLLPGDDFTELRQVACARDGHCCCSR